MNCHGLDYVKHNIGSIEQALMVVKSPQNMECYKKRWFLAMEEFSFCYKASLGRFFLLKRSCRYMAFDIRYEGILSFKFSSNASKQDSQTVTFNY